MTNSSNLLVRQKGDAPFTKDPSVSYTMPARFYTSPDIYEIEKGAIFYKSWHYAGHASQLSEERSYITTSIHNQNIFIFIDDFQINIFWSDNLFIFFNNISYN